jgi:hypothetical protein
LGRDVDDSSQSKKPDRSFMGTVSLNVYLYVGASGHPDLQLDFLWNEEV